MSDYQKILTLEAEKQWQITKGHLRCSVSLAGQIYGGLPSHLQTEEPKFDKFGRVVEDFIKEIESNELYIPEESR